MDLNFVKIFKNQLYIIVTQKNANKVTQYAIMLTGMNPSSVKNENEIDGIWLLTFNSDIGL